MHPITGPSHTMIYTYGVNVEDNCYKTCLCKLFLQPPPGPYNNGYCFGLISCVNELYMCHGNTFDITKLLKSVEANWNACFGGEL